MPRMTIISLRHKIDEFLPDTFAKTNVSGYPYKDLPQDPNKVKQKKSAKS